MASPDCTVMLKNARPAVGMDAAFNTPQLSSVVGTCAIAATGASVQARVHGAG